VKGEGREERKLPTEDRGMLYEIDSKDEGLLPHHHGRKGMDTSQRPSSSSELGGKGLQPEIKKVGLLELDYFLSS